ncbi:hypothetical protein F9K50_07045 [bacterium]|nr:MAG: hypothetical protein F9K50_07045 [bacterium]
MKKAFPYFLLFFVFATSGPLAPLVRAEQKFDVEKAIAAGDHKSLAEYYRGQAAAYRQQAQKHKKMEVTYVEAQEYWGTTYLPKHCAELVKKSNEMAELYEKLAQAEEKLSMKK